VATFLTWLIGRDPKVRVMLLACTERLALETAEHVRDLFKSGWVRDVFPHAKIRKGRDRAGDYRTSEDGGLLATSIHASFTGLGGDIIVVDDPVDLSDAGNDDAIERVNEKFEAVVMSRLNDRRRGRVLVVAHRIAENDLTGHLLEEGGYRHLALPFIAKRAVTHRCGDVEWRRRRGELLRRDAYTESDVDELRRRCLTPDFSVLYQQLAYREQGVHMRPSYFEIYRGSLPERGPFIMSVDPGHTASGESCTSMQIWQRVDEMNVLRDQWLDDAGYDAVRHAFMRFFRRYRPSLILVEETGFGSSLISEFKQQAGTQIVPVRPKVSKATRIAAHAKLFKTGRILLAPDFPDLERYIREFVNFPAAGTDQVDATTQFLDFITEHGAIPSSPAQAVGAHALGATYGPEAGAPAARHASSFGPQGVRPIPLRVQEKPPTQLDWAVLARSRRGPRRRF
jgi:phage terminase large subunit-like protein